MKTITVTTPENIEINYRLAGLGSRAAAAAIDMMVIALALLVVLWISLSPYFSSYGGFMADFLPRSLIAINLIIVFVILFGYFIISEMALKGQSIGKKLLGLRVIRQNGQPVGFFQSIVRNLFRYFVDLIGVGVLCIFFSKTHRRAGDMAAGTIVVLENPGQISAMALTASELAVNTAQTPETSKYAVTPEEYAILTEYFNRKDSFFDKGESAGEKLREYFAKRLFLDEARVDDAILAQIMELNRPR